MSDQALGDNFVTVLSVLDALQVSKYSAGTFEYPNHSGPTYFVAPTVSAAILIFYDIGWCFYTVVCLRKQWSILRLSLKSNPAITLDDEVRLIWVSQFSPDSVDNRIILQNLPGHWPTMDTRKIALFCGRRTIYSIYDLLTYNRARYGISPLPLPCKLRVSSQWKV